MRAIYRDSISTVLAIVGGIAMFAKLNSYSWWFLGSWTGALGVLAVIGLAMLLTNAVEVFKMADGAAVAEFSLWVAATTVVVASLSTATTKAEFIWSGTLIGLAWLVQTTRHAWHFTHLNRHHYIPVG